MSGGVRRAVRLSDPTVARLPIYQRIAEELSRRGGDTIASDDLGRLAGVTAATVRRDLAAIGATGMRGAGYDTSELARRLTELLGGHAEHPTVVAGIGNLARALINSPLFTGRVSRIVALYDVDPQIVGSTVAGLVVGRLHEEDVQRFEVPPAIGVITCPPGAAQEVAEGFCELGIRALMTFSPRVLDVPPEVTVRYVDVSIELQILSYHLEHGRGPLNGGVIHSLGRSPIQAVAHP